MEQPPGVFLAAEYMRHAYPQLDRYIALRQPCLSALNPNAEGKVTVLARA